MVSHPNANCTANFEARLFIVDDAIAEKKVWVYELDPLEKCKRPSEEWVEEHLADISIADLRDLFALPEGNYQVLFKGYLNGWFSQASGEWDEHMGVETYSRLPIPEDYAEILRGGGMYE